MENEKKTDGIYDARKLGVPKMLILGIQHLFAMFGATILVPILVSGYFTKAGCEGLNTAQLIQMALFCAGAGTLFFHVCTKLKVPAFLGSSFAFLGGFESIANLSKTTYAGMTANDVLAHACGGIVVAGLLYLVMALIMKLVGVRRVMRFLPPVVTGPIIILIGLSLAGSAVGNASNNWYLAILSLVIIVAANIWGKGMIKIIPILLGVAGAYLVAVVLHFCGFTNPDGSAIINFSGVVAAVNSGVSGFIGLPKFHLAKFDFTSILVMAPIAIASMMEHIGDISSISATVGSNFVEDPGLQRTLVGDGIATALAGMVGGPANTTYGENTGVLALSKVYDPRVIRLAAIFAVALSLFPVAAQVIGSIPAAIIGGVSFVLYGMISAIGVRNMVETHVDLTNSRNLIVAAVILVSGLGFSNGITFEIAGASITLTSLAIAAIVGIFTNAILPGKDYEYKN
ncbi:MAG: uracil-xanthine permease family protein [Faecousia sp.]